MFEKGDIVSAQNIYLHNCESRINESDVNLSSDIGCHNPHKIYDLLCRVIFGSNPKNNVI